jgi:hypothetical protein
MFTTEALLIPVAVLAKSLQTSQWKSALFKKSLPPSPLITFAAILYASTKPLAMTYDSRSFHTSWAVFHI